MTHILTDIRYSQASNDDLTCFLELYIKAFPSEERRAEWINENDVADFMSKHKQMNIIIIRSGKEFVGFMSYWNFQDIIYVEHFAILEKYRGNKIGTRMLNYVKEQICNKIILEVELPTNIESEHRIAFYKKNGFHLWDNIEYFQPPYSSGQKSMPMILMTYGMLSLKENDAIIGEIKREVYGVGPT